MSGQPGSDLDELHGRVTVMDQEVEALRRLVADVDHRLANLRLFVGLTVLIVVLGIVVALCIWRRIELHG